jgi:hypothetical protein
VLLLATAAAALAAPALAHAGIPNDPLAVRQWYLGSDRAFDAFDALSQLLSVKVAVIDSGVDSSHPELKGRILDSRSFVGGTTTDVEGHGTFVAGEIAALSDNKTGIAGLAPPARLLIAKVVSDDGTIPPKAEARAIRWAVRSGARVINLSLGSTRDPTDPNVDGFSRAERRAIELATRGGAVVVAAVGNAVGTRSRPWRYASYPAALPHVVGVAAYGRSGEVPSFSNRDAVYVDLSAPGVDMFSLFPRPLTQKFGGCQEQGYSSCGPKEYRHAEGTSFASPQVAAAAALLLSEQPSLRSDQVTRILEHSAIDATPGTGCSACTAGRDALTGFGRLNIAAALNALQDLPPLADRFEPNDDVRIGAAVRTRAFSATLDAWDDPNDVYRIHLAKGQRISVSLRSNVVDTSLVLWKPRLRSLADATDDLRARRSVHGLGVTERIRFRARKTGWYSLHVKLAKPGTLPYAGAYTLRLAL